MPLPYRKLSLVALDCFLLSVAYLFAFWARLGSEELPNYGVIIAQTLPIVLIISIYVHLRSGLFNAVLRYASIDTAVAIFKAVTISLLVSCLVLFILFRLSGVPRSIFVIHGMAALILVGGSRLWVRFLRRGAPDSRIRKPIILYGAGDNADFVLRGLEAGGFDFMVVAIVDEETRHQGQSIRGVAVLGGVAALDAFARNQRFEEVWVCDPDLLGEPLRRLYERTSALNVPVKILPRLQNALLGTDLQRIHEPEIADLLRRPPRRLDRDRMGQWIKGRRVLITGAGGSIGSELVRQVSGLGPSEIALCDASEENLFLIHAECVRKGGPGVRPYLLDVCDRDLLAGMFREFKPEIVFHAAAYKHVPLVELNPCEAVLNNVLGLWHVAEASIESGVTEFVFISTDKAVRPVNVMGATKRLGELLVQALNERKSTRFMAVRFGNVLGSSGSVVPLFLEQIRQGGPVTVTHPEMSRYFMLISEAVELVIQAGSIGRGGEVFILDMGKPVRIADMANDLIRLTGKQPGRDIRVEFIGVRPGEKLHEELLISPDDSKTSFPDIWIDHSSPSRSFLIDLEDRMSWLIKEARAGDRKAMLLSLHRLVSDFVPAYGPTRELLEGAVELPPVPAAKPLPSLPAREAQAPMP